MAMNGVLLTVAEVERWRKEKEQLEVEIRERQEQLTLLKRKVDAADIFSVKSDIPEETTAIAEETNGTEDSVPVVLSANLRETGQSLNVRQIRARLIELGFGDKIKKRHGHFATRNRRMCRRRRRPPQCANHNSRPYVRG